MKLKKHWPEGLAFVLGLAAIHAIFFAEAFRIDLSGSISQASAAAAGSFIGGYFGTLFSFLSVLLLIMTIRRQAESFHQERFESRLFKLLELHRDNVSEMKLQEEGGRRVFVKLLDEFRAIHATIKFLATRQNRNFSKVQLVQISYYCLFFGVGRHSTRMLRRATPDLDPDFISALVSYLEHPTHRMIARRDSKLGYEPFEGHQSRLGHYFRHLYQMMKFIDRQSDAIDKVGYAKMLRAQLSTHEQALLLLNTLTPLGAVWWTEKLIDDYRMVRNLPSEFLDPEEELDVSQLFESDYFEWQETIRG